MALPYCTEGKARRIIDDVFSQVQPSNNGPKKLLKANSDTETKWCYHKSVLVFNYTRFNVSVYLHFSFISDVETPYTDIIPLLRDKCLPKQGVLGYVTGSSTPTDTGAFHIRDIRWKLDQEIDPYVHIEMFIQSTNSRLDNIETCKNPDDYLYAGTDIYFVSDEVLPLQ